MKNRLLLLISTLNISKKDFAEAISLSPSNISDFLNGRLKSISTEAVSSIHKVYNISPTWLITGKGEMFAPDSKGLDAQEMKVLRAYREKVELQPAVNILLGVDDSIEPVIPSEPVEEEIEPQVKIETPVVKEDEPEYEVKRHKTFFKVRPEKPKEFAIPELGRIAAGTPIWAEENIEGYVAVQSYNLPRRIRLEDLFALKVVGNSMINADIFDGDTVVFEKVVSVHDQINNGDIVAVLIEDKATLKRVFFVKNGLELKPENPEVEPIFLSELDFVLIQGKLVVVIRAKENKGENDGE